MIAGTATLSNLTIRASASSPICGGDVDEQLCETAASQTVSEAGEGGGSEQPSVGGVGADVRAASVELTAFLAHI